MQKYITMTCKLIRVVEELTGYLESSALDQNSLMSSISPPFVQNPPEPTGMDQQRDQIHSQSDTGYQLQINSQMSQLDQHSPMPGHDQLLDQNTLESSAGQPSDQNSLKTGVSQQLGQSSLKPGKGQEVGKNSVEPRPERAFNQITESPIDDEDISVSKEKDVREKSMLPLDTSYGLRVIPSEGQPPFSKFANLVLCGLEPGQGRQGRAGTVFLENPVGYRRLDLVAFVGQVQSLFGLRGTRIRLFQDSSLSEEVKDDAQFQTLARNTLFVTPSVLPEAGRAHRQDIFTNGCSTSGSVSPGECICRCVNLEHLGTRGTLVLENPKGEWLSPAELQSQEVAIFEKSFGC